MSTDIETAFHTSLDRLLRGEATLDACVAAHPEHDERLRDMLVVALDLQALAPLPLDRQAVERGARLMDDELQRLRARLDRQPEPASAWERLTWWFPRFMPVRMAGLAAAFAIALMAYGGVTLAAVNSGPDSALYGYRLTLEELRIGFAPDEEKAYLYLDTAEQRLREIESAAGLGDSVAVARASTAYQEVVRKGVDVLGAVARETRPGTERTGEVAADYRRRLAEHDTRFDSLTTRTSEAQRTPITRARSLVQAGLQDVHSGPILLAAPTAAPDSSPAPTAAAPAPVSSPSPTPAAFPAPPVSPTPAAPTAAPTATPTAAATPQATPEPTAAATPVPAIDITGSAVIVTGDLQAVTDEALVVAGITIRRGDVATVDGVPLTARVRAEAIVAGDGTLTLVEISVEHLAAEASEAVADSQPTAAPETSPSPAPTPTEGTPPPTDELPEGATPTETPEASPSPDAAPIESTPAAGESPAPTPDGSSTATQEATPSQETTSVESTRKPDEQQTSTEPSPTPSGTETPTAPTQPLPEASAPQTPGEGEPTTTPTGDAQPPEVSPTPEGEPTPTSTGTPEATPSPESTPAEATPPAEPPATPTASEGAPTTAPEGAPTPDPMPTDAPVAPTPTEGEPTATPSPEATPTEPSPTPDVEPPTAPLPPTLQGILVTIDSFTVRAGGIVFSRPLDTPLVLHGPMAPGDVVVVTFEALRAASSYVLVAREVAPTSPPEGPVATRWQGFVGEVGDDAFTLNGVRLQVAPAVREGDVWASLEAGVLVEIDLTDPAAAEPVAQAVRLLGSGAVRSFSNLAGPPLG